MDKGGCKIGKKSDKGGCKVGKKKVFKVRNPGKPTEKAKPKMEEKPKPKKKIKFNVKPKVEEKPKPKKKIKLVVRKKAPPKVEEKPKKKKGNQGRFLEKGSAKFYKDNVARLTAEITARSKTPDLAKPKPAPKVEEKPKLKTVSLRLYGGGMPMKKGFERRGTDVFINREIGRVFSSQKRVDENRPDGNIVKIKMGRGKKAKEGILIGDKIWEKDTDYGYDYGNVMRYTKVNYTLKL